jgi:hypothetical protein
MITVGMNYRVLEVKEQQFEDKFVAVLSMLQSVSDGIFLTGILAVLLA